MNKIKWLNNPEIIVFIVIAILCAIEYILNYIDNAPFKFEHLVKWGLMYPLYGIYVHKGKTDTKFETHETEINALKRIAEDLEAITKSLQQAELKKRLETLEKAYIVMQNEVKLLLRILPKFLSKAHREEFQKEVEAYHQQQYKEDE